MTKRFRDRPRVRTGLSVVPSLFTIGNMFAGYYSIASTMSGNYDHAAIAIFVGAVLDTLDGRIARLTDTASEFGMQLDSLADLLTFGVAPSMLALNWGVISLGGIPGFQDVYNLGWLATFGFLIAGALRLARFNVMSAKPSDKAASKRHFVGLPIPAAAGVIAAVVHFNKAPITLVGSALQWSILVAALAFLMISTIRYPSFKDVDLKKPPPRSALLACAMLIGLIAFYSEETLLIIATVYMASGPVLRISQAVRKRLHQEAEEPDKRAESHGDIS
jgi:CDP-diacylglycerol--serine O-phosphatidyltransferase